jgi:hypothetical protein
MSLHPSFPLLIAIVAVVTVVVAAIAVVVQIPLPTVLQHLV